MQGKGKRSPKLAAALGRNTRPDKGDKLFSKKKQKQLNDVACQDEIQTTPVKYGRLALREQK